MRSRFGPREVTDCLRFALVQFQATSLPHMRRRGQKVEAFRKCASINHEYSAIVAAANSPEAKVEPVLLPASASTLGRRQTGLTSSLSSAAKALARNAHTLPASEEKKNHSTHPCALLSRRPTRRAADESQTERQ